MKTHFSHFLDHCVVYACFECSLIFVFEPSCSTLSERAQTKPAYVFLSAAVSARE